MNAWVRAAGKLARYEHIGWNAWPHSRCWSFHSGASAIAGSSRGCSSGSSRASWPAARLRLRAAERAVWRCRHGRCWSSLATLRSRPGRWVAEHSTAEFRRSRRAGRQFAPAVARMSDWVVPDVPGRERERWWPGRRAGSRRRAAGSVSITDGAPTSPSAYPCGQPNVLARSGRRNIVRDPTQR